MEIFIICLASFVTAILTFFSGFGLGTIMAPVFAIFFPIDIAIASTAIVHFSNNIFKFSLIGKHADKKVLLKFGIPAVLAAFAGAWVLIQISGLSSIYGYHIGNKEFAITPVKLIIASLLILFSIIEILPSAQHVQFDHNKLVYGGILSGFFGGLSGIQGAIRSAFLIKSGLSKESYIATGVVIAIMVDISRLSVYFSNFKSTWYENIHLIVAAIFSAILGALIGRKLLKKVTFRSIQVLVAILLIIISFALGSGII